jgi:hypothetical protein
MEKSAVEWFYKELKELIKQSELTEMKPSDFDDRETKLLEQGKEMEKEQQGYNDEEVIEILLTFRAENPRYIEEFIEQFKKK